MRAQELVREVNAPGELSIDEDLIDRFVSKGWQIRGEGQDQMVFHKPGSPTVLKIVGFGSLPRQAEIRRYVEFFRANQRNPHYPRVGPDRELTWKGRRYYAYTQELLRPLPGDEAVLDYLENFIGRYDRDPAVIQQDIPPGLTYEQVDGLTLAIDRMFDAGFSGSGYDLGNVYNIMQRGNGQLVIVDPFSSLDDDLDEQVMAEGLYDANPATYDLPRRPLNVPELIRRGAIFITDPHGPKDWEPDSEGFSLITLYNVMKGGWPAEAKQHLKPSMYKIAADALNRQGPGTMLYDGKYRQILWSIKKLRIPDEVAFLDKQGVNEVKILSKIKGKGSEPSQLPRFGRAIEPEKEEYYLGKKIGGFNGYQIWRDWVGGQLGFHLFDPRERRVVITTFGSQYKGNPGSYIIHGLYAAPGNPVKAHQFYRALIQELGLTLISDRKQSPGGNRVWQNLERYPDVTVYGYDTKTGEMMNFGARDSEMYAIPAKAAKNPENKYIANNLRLVATAKR